MNTNLEEQLLKLSFSAEIDSGNLQAAMRLILNAIMDGLHVKRVGIWLLDETSDAINCQLLLDRANDVTIESFTLARDAYPTYFDYLDKERTIIVNDAHTHPATQAFSKDYLTPLGITSMLDVPIRHKGKMIGIICIEHIGEPKTWQDEDITFAGAMTDIYVRALSAEHTLKYQAMLEQANSQLEARVKARTKELETTVADLKHAQSKLIEAEKMASLGSLVAGISHEVNTPIGIAVTSTSSAKDTLTHIQDAPQTNRLTRNDLLTHLGHLTDCISLAESNLERAAELIANFKKTAVDQSSLELSELNIHDYIHQVLKSITPIIKSKAVSVHVNCPEHFTMHTYPGVIAQIIINLVNNSCIHGFKETTDNQIFISVTPLKAQKQVHIRYQDNGRGMDSKTAKRALEPFYTTNRAGGGSGLGLAIVYNLITQAFSGTLTLTSQPNEGIEINMQVPTDKPTNIAPQ